MTIPARRRSPAVTAAFGAVDRRDFLPEAARRRAGEDRPISIGDGQTNSQPTTVADMLELLEVEPGHRALDVGSGSGWTTALLGRLVGPTGEVVAVELIPELAAWGAANVARQGMGWVRVETARPDLLGRPEEAPYDRILVSANARELPLDLVAQLEVGGLLVCPVASRMLRVRRTEGDTDTRADGAITYEVSEHGAYSFVPLIT